MTIINLEDENILYPTLNNMGYTAEYPDIIQKAFIEFSSNCDNWVLDIGAAYGVSTLPAIKKGAKVIANDLDQRHLDIIAEKTPLKFKKNLKLNVGKLPEIHIENTKLDAILVARVLHFLSPSEIMESLRLIKQLLCKNGKLFIVVTTPYIKILEKYLPVYQEKKLSHDPWPGLIENANDFLSEPVQMPMFVNLFDKDLLERILTSEGFNIQDLFYFPAECPKKWLYDGREFLGCIADKS